MASTKNKSGKKVRSIDGKRRDSNGRVLKPGESQRPNRTYQYRWQACGKICTIYAPTLDMLREKEKDILRDVVDEIDVSAQKKTVRQYIDKYLSLKRNLRPRTAETYTILLKSISKDPLMKMQIGKVRFSDVKEFYLRQSESGKATSTLKIVNAIVSPAFSLAVKDDVIRRNPIFFRDILMDLPKDTRKGGALTADQEEKLFRLAESMKSKYLDVMIILRETGLRIGELSALTLSDVDLERRVISVNKQIDHLPKVGYTVGPPKSDSGIRRVPLSTRACISFRRVIDNRPRVPIELVVDGVGGFVFISKHGNPDLERNLAAHLRKLNKAYREKYGESMPRITAHVFRHTFVTRNLQYGLDVRTVSGLAGHKNINITLEKYDHYDPEFAEQAFRRVNG